MQGGEGEGGYRAGRERGSDEGEEGSDEVEWRYRRDILVYQHAEQTSFKTGDSLPLIPDRLRRNSTNPTMRSPSSNPSPDPRPFLELP